MPYSKGATWSTDAAYRETQPEADYFRSLGVKTVDMESAGLFAVGQVRGVETASIFVVGDQINRCALDVAKRHAFTPSAFQSFTGHSD